MGLADSIEWLRSRLDREGWAAVLVVAGVALLVAPPTEGGVALVGWLVVVLAGSFVVVFVGSRALTALRG